MTSRGTVRGLQEALNGALQALRTSLNELELAQVGHVTLPLRDWEISARIESLASANIEAFAASYLAYTVPANRRVYLFSLRCQRSAGANTIKGFRLTYPTGYGTGNRLTSLLFTGTGVTDLTWPQRATTFVTEVTHTPVLLEPGTELTVLLGEAGAAVSTFVLTALMTETPLVRARVP